MGKVHVYDHPLIQHKMTIMRKVETGTKQFRELVDEVSSLMAYEITRDLPLTDVEIETPVSVSTQKMIAGKKLGIVPILRAGLGMVDGFLKMMPNVKVGHIGLYRDPETLEPHDTISSCRRTSQNVTSSSSTRCSRQAVQQPT